MLKSYFVITVRNLMKNKVISFINIFGLSVGIAAALFILRYVDYETHYDSFHANVDKIYRVALRWYKNQEPDGDLAMNFYGAGPAMVREFPEVESFARFRSWSGRTIVSNEDTKMLVDKIYFADPSIFTMFSFPVTKGNAQAALSAPGSMMISESLSKKIFGNEDPMGRELQFKQGESLKKLTVNGVFADVPENSHIKFNILISYIDLGDFGETNWAWSEVYTYVMFREGADLATMQKMFPRFIEKYNGDEMKARGFSNDFILQPLRDIHLKSHLDSEIETNGDGSTVYFLLAIAIIILVIAYVNYINLTTAEVINKAKEIGIKKVIGANKTQLVYQHLFMFMTFNLIAIFFGIVLQEIITALLAQSDMDLSYGDFWNQPWIWGALFGLLIFGTFAAGTYPAFILSSFEPIATIKGYLKTSAAGLFIRKSLIVFQFIASIILIAVTLTVYSQINHMRHERLGIDINEVTVIDAPIVKSKSYDYLIKQFKSELLTYPFVKDVTVVTQVPGKKIDWRSTVIHKQNATQAEVNEMQMIGVDPGYIKTFGLQLVAGRDFNEDMIADKKGLIINEAALAPLGFENAASAIGYLMVWDEREDGTGFQIIGVVKNYHQTSVKDNVEPIVMTMAHDWDAYIAVRIQTSDVQGSLNTLKTTYNKYFAENTFSYFFLDEFFDYQYKSDQKFGIISGLFTIVAIVISSLGLIGLMSLTLYKRSREVSIHKVFGASSFSVFYLLAKDIIFLVVVALVIAIPVAYVLMSNWLLSFVSRVELGLWFFSLPGLAILIIVLIMISYHIIKVTSINPAKVLKDN
jgi:putative ABC transport system permease protein